MVIFKYWRKSKQQCIKRIVKLKTWQEITDIPKEKQGTAKALSLPEETEWSICETVFDKLSITELKAEEGFKTLVPFFDNKS